jgi:hypothetical protein
MRELDCKGGGDSGGVKRDGERSVDDEEAE